MTLQLEKDKLEELTSVGPKLRNFSFQERLDELELGPIVLKGNFHLLVGKSGMGKTRTLNVLFNLKNSVQQQKFFSFSDNNSYSFKLSVSHLFKGREICLDYKYSVSFKEKVLPEDLHHSIKAIDESVFLDGKEILQRHNNKVNVEMSDEKKEVLIPTLPYSFKIPFGNDEIDSILQCLTNFFVGIRRLNDNTAPSIDIDPIPLKIVEPDGRGLSSSFETMKIDEPQAYERILTDFNTIYDGITGMNFKIHNNIKLPVHIMHLTEKGVVKEYPVTEAAGGISRILSILNLIHAPGPRSLICIDEIDSNLDAVRINRLLQHIRDENESLPQILAVSHNPYFQDRCDLTEWVVTKKHGNKIEYYFVDESKLDPIYTTGLYGNSRLFQESLYDEPKLPLTPMY